MTTFPSKPKSARPQTGQANIVIELDSVTNAEVEDFSAAISLLLGLMPLNSLVSFEIYDPNRTE